MEYYSKIKKNELLIYTLTRNLKLIIVNERDQTKKNILYNSVYVKL